MIRKFIAILLIALQLFGSTWAHAAFENQVSGGRATGMSNAYTAVADDASAIIYNPAGMYQVVRPEITAHYGRLVTGLDDGSSISQTMLGWAQEWKQVGGGLGAAYTDMSLAGLYGERMIAAGYSQTFMNRKLALGAAFKSLQVSVGQDAFSNNALDLNGNAQIGVVDPVLAKARTRTATAFDVGVMARPWEKTTLGLALQNINQPDIGLAEKNPIPLITRLGVSYRERLTVIAFDITRKTVLQGVVDSVMSLGYEKAIPISEGNTILARAGITNGSRQLKQLSFGFGWRGDKTQFDYSFLLPMGGLESSNNTHRLALTYRFNWPFRVAIEGKQEKAPKAKKKRVEPVEEESKQAPRETTPSDAERTYEIFKAQWRIYEQLSQEGAWVLELLSVLEDIRTAFKDDPAIVQTVDDEIKSLRQANGLGE